jgi:L-asparaginase
MGISDPSQSRVYVAYTGGTIGMRNTPAGYTPARGLLETFLRTAPELTAGGIPDFRVQEYETLLDSSNMVPSDWNRIAADIERHYEQFDGFVVLHGTDTMAYSASALSFMLEGLAKPVILTGSQIPLTEIRNDARDNLLTALIIAGTSAVPEVCLYFNGVLFRGNRAVKVNASGLDAFDSPNHPPLGRAGIHIEIDRQRILSPVRVPMRTRLCQGENRVAAIRLFPGISSAVLENILKPPLRGLVMECYGAGNAPDREPSFLETIRSATERGVVVVDVTQCVRGSVDLGSYATGSALAHAGVIGGFDMTAEAALTKLLYLLELGLDPDRIKREMQRNLRGELTVPEQHAGNAEAPGC